MQERSPIHRNWGGADKIVRATHAVLPGSRARDPTKIKKRIENLNRGASEGYLHAVAIVNQVIFHVLAAVLITIALLVRALRRLVRGNAGGSSQKAAASY